MGKISSAFQEACSFFFLLVTLLHIEEFGDGIPLPERNGEMLYVYCETENLVDIFRNARCVHHVSPLDGHDGPVRNDSAQPREETHKSYWHFTNGHSHPKIVGISWTKSGDSFLRVLCYCRLCVICLFLDQILFFH